MTEFSGLVDFGKGGTTDQNQEYRKRNKSVRVDNVLSFAYAALDTSAREPGISAPKAVGIGYGMQERVGVSNTDLEVISRHLIV